MKLQVFPIRLIEVFARLEVVKEERYIAWQLAKFGLYEKILDDATQGVIAV